MDVSKPAKAGFFYIFTNILAKGIAFLVTPLFTRLLSPSEYGVYSLYTSWIGILGVALSLGISVGAVYRGLGKFEGREEEFISSAVSMLFALCACVSAIALFFISKLKSFTGLAGYINILLIGEVFLNSAQTVFFAARRYKYDYLKICVINLLYAVLTPGISVILIYLTPIKAEARILSSFSVTAVLILPEALKKIKFKSLFKLDITKYLARLSFPLLPSSLAMTLIAQSDKLMVERFSGAAKLAEYSVAYSLGFMLTSLTSAIYSALQPWLMRKLNSGDSAGAKRFTERIIFLVSLGLVVFLTLVPELFKLVAPSEYRSAELAVYPLAAAGILQFVSNILASNIIHTEKTAYLSLMSVAAFVLNLGLNIVLIPRYGYFAAAITTTAAYAVLIFLEYMLLLKLGERKIIEAKSFIPLFLSLYAIPIVALRQSFNFRLLSAFIAVLISLPTATALAKDLIKKSPKKRI